MLRDEALGFVPIDIVEAVDGGTQLMQDLCLSLACTHGHGIGHAVEGDHGILGHEHPGIAPFEL